MAMELAIAEAELYWGATSPNPAVGAAGLDRAGNVLAVAAHQRAGAPHAERNLITKIQELGKQNELFAVVVTLEPCNHHGRTPPCTDAILAANVSEVYFGSRDENSAVIGNGAKRLAEAGILIKGGVLAEKCAHLTRSFFHHARTGKPWVTLKQAFRVSGSMIPESGTKTFTSPENLVFAHRLRQRADAILTGSGTVLADDPLFTVRLVPDFTHKARYLALLDRRQRVSEAWKERTRSAGFKLLEASSVSEALVELGRAQCLEVLVEAGPELSEYFLTNALWDEHVVLREGSDSSPEIRFREPLACSTPKGELCSPV